MEWVVNVTSRPPLSPGKTLYPLYRGWMGPSAGLNRWGRSRSTGIRSPNLPGRSESLYRLSYPGTCPNYALLRIIWVRAAVYVVTQPVLVFTPKCLSYKSGRKSLILFPSGKKYISVMEGSQLKSVKRKMKDRKLRSVVNWQGALKRKWKIAN